MMTSLVAHGKVTRNFRSALCFSLLVFAAREAYPADAPPPTGAIEPVTLANTLSANDDGSTGIVPLNIGGTTGINFFGTSFTNVFVNNNGNLTFTTSLGTYTPNGLATGVGQPIIAPFFADVDTRGPGSGLVMYGNALIGGLNAFVANYVRVGYYGGHTDKLNSFQVILFDRSDTGTGNFDIEFNYNQIQWEAGDASEGSGGLGGVSAVAGYSNGLTGDSNVFFQLPGSLVNGALLDSGPNALSTHSLNSTVPGRYIFSVRSGMVVVGPPPPPTTAPFMVTGVDLGTIPLGSSLAGSVSVLGGSPPYGFTLLSSLPAGLTYSGSGIGGIPMQPGNYSVAILVTDSAGVSSSANITYSVFGLSSASLPNAVTSSLYTQSIGAIGGTLPYTFSATGLPPGFNLSSSGLLSGTARTTGTYRISVMATDGSGITSTGTLTLVVTVPPPLLVPPVTLAPGTVGVGYSQSVMAAGGAPPYSWSVAAGSLPTGLSFNSTGILSGTPSAVGTYTFSARATDVTGGSATGTITVSIGAMPLTVNAPSPLPSGVSGVNYPTQFVTASGGVGPYTYAVTSGALPAGLTLGPDGSIGGTPKVSGTSNFTVTVTDANRATGTANLQINVRLFSTDLFLSAASLSFSSVSGSPNQPPSQTVQVQSTAVGTVLSYSTAVTPSVSWLSVSPAGGSTPGSFTVSLTNQALTLPASSTPYTATIVVNCTSGPCSPNPQMVAVSLTVTALPPQLSVLSSLVAFTTGASTPRGSSQTLGLQNTGGGVIGISSVTAGAPWVTVTGVPGSIANGPPVPLNISLDPTGLSAGYYRSTVTIVSSAGTVVVPVTLFIASNPSLALAPAGMRFQVSAGGAPGNAGNSFLVDTSSTTSVNWTASVLPGSNWLSVTNTSGTASNSLPGVVNFSIDPVIAAGLAPQAYYGRIRVSASGVVNTPLDFEVVLNIAPATDPQKPSLSPSGLLFLTSGTSGIPAQTVQIFSNSAGPLPYQATASTMDGAAWLSVTPTVSSATPTGSPSQVSISTAGLAPGVYYGGVSYAFGAAGVRTVNVTLVVESGTGGVTSSGAPITALSLPKGVCAPTVMVPAQVGLVNNFSAPTAWPTPLAIQLVTDCGTPITNGQVVATFSNGDPPLALTLANGSSGLYSGTWTPRHSSMQVAITARATATGFPAATATLSGAVTPNAAPILTPSSTLHIFNPLVGAGLSPGTIVQLYGAYLAPQTTSASSIPLATTLSGTSVIIGGIQAPLYFVSPGQINAQIPFELAAGQQYQVIVNANGALTTPDTIQVTPYSPGLAALPNGAAIAQHGDGTLVTETSPAKPGEFLVMYTAGLGPTDSPVATGSGSPVSPLAHPQTAPTVTINGEQATVAFAGLTPGLVGLYQINFQVPADVKTGDLALVITQNGTASNSTILPVKAGS